jgi:chromosome segregation ATPase
MKVYVKSVTNIADLQAKIAKKQAELDKKKAWIQKKEEAITKKLALLKGNIDDSDYNALVPYLEYVKEHDKYRVPADIDVNTWRLVDKYHFTYDDKYGKALYSIDDDAASIYTSNQGIKEIKQVIDNYNAKLDKIKSTNDEIDRIPECLKEFMNDIIARWDAHDKRIRDESKPYYRELKQRADEILYEGANSWNRWEVEQAKLEELYPDLPKSGWGLTREKKFKSEYIIEPFEAMFGSLNYARSLWDMTDEQIHAQNQRDGEHLILDLLKRVTKITGPVRDWSGLHVTQGNMGAVLNGYVVGDDGKARVESILAGGYNIQRLHVRTLVKPV